MRERVRGIAARIFKVPVNSISDDSSPETVESWDSLGHLQLILALEEEFGVHFSVDEIGTMQSIGSILTVLGKHTNA